MNYTIYYTKVKHAGDDFKAIKHRSDHTEYSDALAEYRRLEADRTVGAIAVVQDGQDIPKVYRYV